MSLLQLPDELLEQIIHDVISSTDLINVSLACKTLNRISSPFRYEKLNIVLPWGPTAHNLAAETAFNKISAPWVQYLQHLELSHRGRYGNWEPDPVCLFVDKEAVFQETTTSIIKEGFVEYRGPLNDNLMMMFGRLRPNQIKSFKYLGRRTYSNPAELRAESFLSVALSHNLLTKLEIVLDREIIAECSLFAFPRLKTFKYIMSDYGEVAVGILHSVFSILYSCQNTLEELYTINEGSLGNPFSPTYETDEDDYGLAYDSWRKCEKCCKRRDMARGGKALRLGKLEKWKGTEVVIGDYIKIFDQEKIVDDASLMELTLRHPPYKLSVRAKKDSQFIRPLFDLIRVTDQREHFLRTFLESVSGLQSLIMRPLFGYELSTSWLPSLRYQRDSLQNLDIKLPGINFNTESLEQLGRDCRNLQSLTVEAGREFPSCIFDIEIFPKLRFFNDATNLPLTPKRLLRPAKYAPALKAIEGHYKAGTLSNSLTLLCFDVQLKEIGREVVYGYAFIVEKIQVTGDKSADVAAPGLREVLKSEASELIERLSFKKK